MNQPKSLAWNFFEKVPNGAICMACGKKWDFKGEWNTSQLAKHLLRAKDELHEGPKKHYVELEKQRKLQKKVALEKEQKRASETFGTVPKKLCLGEAREVGFMKLTASNQPTVQQLFSEWNDNGAKSKDMDKSILEMIATDLRPFNIVECQGFQRMIKMAAPRFKIKHRTFYSGCLLKELHSRLKEKVKKIIDLVEYLSFTCGTWTSKTNEHSLLCLTAHYLDAGFDPCFVVLAVKPIVGRHTGKNLSDLIDQVLAVYEINDERIHLLLRDAAKNMVSCANQLFIDSRDCFVHKIQLVTKAAFESDPIFDELIKKCRTIVRKVRKSSILKDELKIAQRLEEIPEHTLINDVEIRWSSKYIMISRLIEQKKALKSLAEDDSEFPELSKEEWNILECLETILKPFYTVTKKLQGRKETISCVIPTYLMLRRKLMHPTIVKLSSFQNTILNALEERMKGWECDRDSLLATALDPRYKTKLFVPNVVEKVKNLLTKEIEDLINQSNPTPSIELKTSEASKRNSYEEMMSELMEDVNQNFAAPTRTNASNKASVMVVDYLSQEVLDFSSCPYEYWRSHQEIYKELAVMVKKYLSAPLGSVESERLFSTASQTVTPLRNSLSEEMLEKLLFLHHNLKIVNYDY